MGPRPRAKAAPPRAGRRRPLMPATASVGRPASCGLRGAGRAQGPSGAGWVGRRALRRGRLTPHESVGGVRRPRELVSGGEGGEKGLPPSGWASAGPFRRRPWPARAPSPLAPPASPSMPRGVGPPWSGVVSRVPPRRVGPPVPASAPARPRPVAPPPPDRPRCHAAPARLGPGSSPAFHRAAPACPFRRRPRVAPGPGLPSGGVAARGPRPGPAAGVRPGPQPPAPLPKEPARRGFVAASQLNLSCVHRAGNPLFYRVFR